MWDERYGGEEYAYGTEPNDFLRDEFQRIDAGTEVLCLAEGEGRNAVFLARRGYGVVAVDRSTVGLEKARRLADRSDVEIRTEAADLRDHDLGDGRWGGIVSIYAHLPADERRDLHRRVARALAPGGVFLLEAYIERQLEMPGVGGPPASGRSLFMSLAGLREELAGLDLVIAREVEREVSEGRYHRGLSAVVQVAARKPS